MVFDNKGLRPSSGIVNVARFLIYNPDTVWKLNFQSGTERHDGANMTHVSELNLVNISWPISILKCSKRVDMMVPGEQLVVSLKNSDTMESLVTLLKTMPEVEYDIRRVEGCYLLRVVRRPEP